MIDIQRTASYLKNLRNLTKNKEGKSLTQNDLANIFYNEYDCEISINAIAEWESGSNLPTAENLEILSKIYNKTIDEILDGEDSKDINFKEVYFIYDRNWYSDEKYKNEDTYIIRHKQSQLVLKRFKELIFIRIDRTFTTNEEKEFRFLFDNFFTLSEYGKEYSSIKVNDDYLKFRDAMMNLLNDIREEEKESKYWEIQKLYVQDSDLCLSFHQMFDILNTPIIKERFNELAQWEKDMFLAMFQNIEPYILDPMNANGLVFYEKTYGEYNPEKTYKEIIKSFINSGACINKYFMNIKKVYKDKKRIIDRLEELYNKCLKPLMIDFIDSEGNIKKYIIENNSYNRFLKNWYFDFSFRFSENKEEKNYQDVDEIYNWLNTNDIITDEVYKKIAINNNIDTNRAKKLWMADFQFKVKIDKLFNEYKLEEKDVKEGLKEIELLKSKLEKGEKEYFIERNEVIGGKDEQSIKDYIEYLKCNLDYSDYLNSREIDLTQELINNIDNLSLREIRQKYFPVEVLEDE